MPSSSCLYRLREKEVPVGNQTELKIELSGEDNQLQGVVVTALGIKRSQKALSYNVQEIKNDALTTVKDANFMNSLNGKVAGVNIQRSASGVVVARVWSCVVTSRSLGIITCST